MRSESIGRRVVVRYRVAGVGPSGGPAMTDVIGHVRAIDATTVTIEHRSGRFDVVSLDQIVTWKYVPERPAHLAD